MNEILHSDAYQAELRRAEMNRIESQLEADQYALLWYLTNKNPGPIIKQLMEERIKELEKLKQKI